MIRLSETKVDERFNISDDGTITALDGTVQKTYFKQNREFFHAVLIYRILMYTRYGWRDGRIWHVHHIDGNPLNNNINNLQYLTSKDHASITNKGKTFSEEHKKKIGNSNKGKRKGCHLSDETKKKLSNALKGRIKPEKAGFKKGVIPWNAGKHLSDNIKQKISISNKGKRLSNETKNKISISRKGKIFINNGIIQKLSFPDNIPEGFIKGKLHTIE